MEIFSVFFTRGGHMMNAKERQEQIIKILRQDGTVKIHDLSERFDVTRETARRDLYELSQSSAVRIVRGGAVLDMTNHETAYDKRLNTSVFAKEAIAKTAMDYVQDGDTIYLDYGTTCLQIGKALRRYKDLTIITNSLPIVNYLYRFDDISVFVLGGDVRRNEESLYGDTAIRSIQNFSINVGFFSGSGFTTKSGVTNHHRGEAELSRAAVQHCEKVIAGIDHTKFGNVFQNRILDLKDMDVIITDGLDDQQQIDAIQAQGVSLKNGNK